MSNRYKLINPYIKGNFKTEYTCSNHIDAGKKIWNKLSNNFSNNIPQFAMTIQDVNDGKYYNLLIEETIKNDKIKYIVSELNGTKINKLKKHLKDLDKIQTGGKRKKRSRHNDEDDSESDTDFSEFYFDDNIHNRMKYNLIKSKVSTPLMWWWWYTPTIYTVESLFIPTFIPTLHPYIEIIV